MALMASQPQQPVPALGGGGVLPTPDPGRTGTGGIPDAPAIGAPVTPMASRPLGGGQGLDSMLAGGSRLGGGGFAPMNAALGPPAGAQGGIQGGIQAPTGPGVASPGLDQLVARLSSHPATRMIPWQQLAQRGYSPATIIAWLRQLQAQRGAAQ